MCVHSTVNPNSECYRPILINFGSVLLENRKSEFIAKYSCFEGYRLSGSATIACNFKSIVWPTEDFPECCKYCTNSYSWIFSMISVVVWTIHLICLLYDLK